MESIGLESPDDHNLSQIWSTFERSSGSVSILLTYLLLLLFLLQKFGKIADFGN